MMDITQVKLDVNLEEDEYEWDVSTQEILRYLNESIRKRENIPVYCNKEDGVMEEIGWCKGYHYYRDGELYFAVVIEDEKYTDIEETGIYIKSDDRGENIEDLGLVYNDYN